MPKPINGGTKTANCISPMTPQKFLRKNLRHPPEKVNDLQSGLEDAIFLECKTKRHQFFDTTLWRFNPTIPELIWVKDTDGLEINFSMTIEGYADGLIKSSFTAEQMLLALLALKDLDPEQKAELGLMKVMYNSFIALSKKLIREGVPPEESKIKAQERMGINLISKQYVELDLSSGEILWIETGLTPPQHQRKKKLKEGLER